MENEVKQRNQRNRRRERAQRMQAQRDSKVKDGDSGEDESPAREKPPRPTARRKKSREPLGEEDIIDGFAIMAFRTYEDLETAVKCASSPRTNSLSTKPRLPLAAITDPPRNHPPNNVNHHNITLLQDAGTSDDSGRASERLTGSSVAPRDPDSSRDRLSDASSRCSSGKGYICDSEGDDDKATPDNSRNASPRFNDTSKEDVSDGSIFRVSGGVGVTPSVAKSELVALGGGGGALVVSRAHGPPAPPPPRPRATPAEHAATPPSRPLPRAATESPTPAPPAPSRPASSHPSPTPLYQTSLHRPYSPRPPNHVLPVSNHLPEPDHHPPQPNHHPPPDHNPTPNHHPSPVHHPVTKHHSAPNHHPVPPTNHLPVPLTNHHPVPLTNHHPVPLTNHHPVPLTNHHPVPPPNHVPPVNSHPRPTANQAPASNHHAPASNHLVTSNHVISNGPVSTVSAPTHVPPAPLSVMSSSSAKSAVSSAPSTYPSSFPLYAPYSLHSAPIPPYLTPAAASPRNTTDTRTGLSSSPLAPKTPKSIRAHTPGSTGAVSYSPRGLSPTRERETYSSVSSLSRPSVSAPLTTSLAAPTLPPPHTVALPTPLASCLPTPLAAPLTTPLAPTLSAPLAAPLAPLAAPLPAPLAAPLATPLAAPLTPLATPLAPTPTAPAPNSHLPHSLAPVPTVGSISSSSKPPAHWGVTSGSDRPAGFPPPLFAPPLQPPNPNPFSAESLFQTSGGAELLRRELDSRFLAAASRDVHHHQHQHTHVHHPHLYPPTHHSLFKDVSKMSLYRGGLGLGYPYSSSLLHPAASYVPPSPLTTYAPKPVVPAPSDPVSKPTRPAVKSGKWNAMHVRIAWEIYNHQQKDKSALGGALSAEKDKRLFPPAPAPAPAPAPPVSAPPVSAAYRSPYDLPPQHYLPHHHPHLGVGGFARYGVGVGLGPYLGGYGRDVAVAGVEWRRAGGQDGRDVAVAGLEWRRPVAQDGRHEERLRRDRDERERERRERERRVGERAGRARSPLRSEPKDVKEAPRYGPPLAPPPPPWDAYRPFDPLQHMRFPPLVEAAIRAEEDRAKMLSAYAHHHQLKAAPLLHRPLSHGPLPPPLSLQHPGPAPNLLQKEEPR